MQTNTTTLARLSLKLYAQLKSTKLICKHVGLDSPYQFYTSPVVYSLFNMIGKHGIHII